MSTPLSVVALQIAPDGTQEQTLDLFEARIRAVAAMVPHATLVVAPEQHLSATPRIPFESADDIEKTSIEIPGPLSDRLGKLAQESGLWLVPGTVYERTDEGTYNTAMVFSPEGELVARYRKIFPWQPFETSRPGSEFVCFDIPGVARVGIAICYDGAFPEVARQLAWMGADVIVQPTLTPTIDREIELVMARANAIANQVYVVNVNASAPHGLGRSMIVDPEGLVRVAAGATEQIITDVLDIDAVSRVREFGTLGLNRYWDQLDRYGHQVELPAYGGRFVSGPRGPSGAKL